MKDKLIRYNHKAGYYVMKRCAIGASIVVASSILIALPLSFGINMVKSNQNEIVEPSNTETNSDLTY